MKLILSFLLLIKIVHVSAQSGTRLPITQKKGEFFAHWGWNRAWYTHSDIHFTGDNYDFTLQNTVAKDRQSNFNFDTYFNPVSVTIPQYNFKAGYFINDHYYLSVAADHMKYVVKQGQTVKIEGEINEPNNPYNGTYNDADILITPGFLELEHTDGLNYLNTEVGRFDNLWQHKKITIGINEAAGVGVMYPRTDAHLFQNQRHDEFHVAGFGIHTQVGINIKFYNHFYIQTEARSGYINMPNIRTTYNKADGAEQDFFFFQCNAVLGSYWNINKK